MKNFSLYRIFIIVSMFLKFVVQHYFFHKRNPAGSRHSQKKLELLVTKQAREYKKKALHLEGLMIKIGQFLSTRADIMPEAFLRELADLIDQVPSIDPEISLRALEEEWNVPIDNHLIFISDKAVASASIGEVFRGRLHSGEEVAIKIQRKDIDKIIKTDFRAMKMVLWLANKLTPIGKEIDTIALHEETVRIIGDELNYTKEVANIHYFQHRFKDSRDYRFPKVYNELSTSRVIVMEWMEGAKVTDLDFMEKHMIDHKEVAKKVFNFFAEQLLDYGKFHADPHQGNLIVQSNGSIAVIDFGMVGEISKTDSVKLRRMIRGFILDDYETVINELQRLNFLMPHANKLKLQSSLKSYIDLYLNSDLNDLDEETINKLLEDLKKIVKEQPIQLPVEFAFLGRAVSIGLGVLTYIDPDVDLIELGKPLVTDWLDEPEDEEGNFKKKLFIDSAKPLLGLPRNIGEWLLAPAKAEQLAEERQLRSFDHQRHLLKVILASLLFFLAIPIATLSFIFNAVLLALIFSVVSFGSLFIMISSFNTHKRWVSKYRN